MLKYEVNAQFPVPHPSLGMEVTLAEITTALIDVKCYLHTPVEEEIMDWKNGVLQYAIFEKDCCPFFIIAFKDWNLDCSINILKIKSETDQKAWLNGEGNLVNLYLIDAATNILKAMRTISVQAEAAEKLRDICKAQIDRFKNAEDCDEKIIEIQNIRPTHQMIKMSNMYTL